MYGLVVIVLAAVGLHPRDCKYPERYCGDDRAKLCVYCMIHLQVTATGRDPLEMMASNWLQTVDPADPNVTAGEWLWFWGYHLKRCEWQRSPVLLGDWNFDRRVNLVDLAWLSELFHDATMVGLYSSVQDRTKLMARPSEYKKVYARQAEQLAAEGKTFSQMARFFGVMPKTLLRWRQENEELETSIARGHKRYQQVQDTLYCREAESSLLRRVKGFSYTETTREERAFPGEEGGEVVTRVVKRVRKRVLPDVGAIKYVLGNRDPERWPKGDAIELDTDPIARLLEQVDGATRHLDGASGAAADAGGSGEPAEADSPGRDGDAGVSANAGGCGAGEISGEYA